MQCFLLFNGLTSSLLSNLNSCKQLRIKERKVTLSFDAHVYIEKVEINIDFIVKSDPISVSYVCNFISLNSIKTFIYLQMLGHDIKHNTET